jgi:hypothetical protein
MTCAKSGKKWNNDHVNTWTLDRKYINFQCIKCGLKRTELRTNALDYLVRSLLVK